MPTANPLMRRDTMNIAKSIEPFNVVQEVEWSDGVIQEVVEEEEEEKERGNGRSAACHPCERRRSTRAASLFYKAPQRPLSKTHQSAEQLQ